MTADDLKLVSTDDLIAELFARYDNAAFAANRAHATEPNVKVLKSRWKGDSMSCVGLAHVVVSDVDDHRRKNCGVAGPDE